MTSSANENEAVTKYKRVVDVISKPPSMRKDFEVNNLISWFRKQSRLFASLKTEMIFDVIKNLSFISKERDDILIKEGDRGDCMYITLRGKSSIYRLSEDLKTTNQQTPSTQNNKENIRATLGDHLVTLGRDAVFGDVALMSDDCIRTASVIVDEPSDYIVVDRELYDRSVKSVLKKEFEDKTNFIARCPYFKSWMPKYRKQLAMAMQKECVPYEGVLAKQGDAVENIFYILSGEVKVVMDPTMHRVQYPKQLSKHVDIPAAESGQQTDDADGTQLLPDALDQPLMSHRSPKTSPRPPTSRNRQQSAARRAAEVCLLGVNESIGDIEILTDLPTYMQTAVCTQRCEVLVLELKHYERLFVRRQQRTVDMMKDGLVLRLETRLTPRLRQSVPLLRCLLDHVQDYKLQKSLAHARAQSAAERQKTSASRVGAAGSRSVAELCESFVPSQGALIDIYGPGTVFYRIRQREAVRLARIKKRAAAYGAVAAALGNTAGGAIRADESLGNGVRIIRMGRRLHEQRRRLREANATAAGGGGNAQCDGEQGEYDALDVTAGLEVDEQTSEPALKNLEQRLMNWLSKKDGKEDGVSTSVGGIRYQPRCAKLHRTQPDKIDDVKVGAKVILRPKVTVTDENLTSRPADFNVDDIDVDLMLSNGNAWV